jgi:hypothetical protein
LEVMTVCAHIGDNRHAWRPRWCGKPKPASQRCKDACSANDAAAATRHGMYHSPQQQQQRNSQTQNGQDSCITGHVFKGICTWHGSKQSTKKPGSAGAPPDTTMTHATMTGQSNGCNSFALSLQQHIPKL